MLFWLFTFHSIYWFTCWLTFKFLCCSTSSLHCKLTCSNPKSSSLPLGGIKSFSYLFGSTFGSSFGSGPSTTFGIYSSLKLVLYQMIFVGALVWHGFFYWGGFSSCPLCRSPYTFFLHDLHLPHPLVTNSMTPFQKVVYYDKSFTLSSHAFIFMGIAVRELSIDTPAI